MVKAEFKPKRRAAGVALWIISAVLLGLPILYSKGIAGDRGQLSEEARTRIRPAVTAVGLIFARNSSDPEGEFPRLRGSAVVIRKDGIIVTNYHVIRHDNDERLYDQLIFSLPSYEEKGRPATRRFDAKPVVISKEYDLALLRIMLDGPDNIRTSTLELPVLEIGDSRKIKLMDDLVIIGFPGKGGSTVTVNPGTVEGIDVIDEWIKTDARLMRGNSGGAAVNSDGKLIGIPSKVILDTQPIDTNGDGLPDGSRPFGAVGFLRPSHLVASMLAQVDKSDSEDPLAFDRRKQRQKFEETVPMTLPSKKLLPVRGSVKSFTNGKPLAGVRLGLVPLGTKTVTTANLLAWGGSDPEGRFELNKRVPPGRYTIKAAAFGYTAFTKDIEVDQEKDELVVQMRPSQ